MSPSEHSQAVPPEVVAIAVALAAVWVEQQPQAQPQTDPWRLAGRRWGRPASYRWS